MSKSTTLFFAAALLLLGQPASAEASGAISPNRADFETAMGTLMLSTSVIGFGIADMLYFAHERPMPIALSVLQIAVGGVLVPFVAMRSSDRGVVVFAAVSSAWFIGHGIYNIAAYSAREKERRRTIAAM